MGSTNASLELKHRRSRSTRVHRTHEWYRKRRRKPQCIIVYEFSTMFGSPRLHVSLYYIEFRNRFLPLVHRPVLEASVLMGSAGRAELLKYCDSHSWR